MGKQKLKGKNLRAIQYSSNKAISLAVSLMAKYYKHSTVEEQLKLLIDIKENYQNYLNHEHLNILAEVFKPSEKVIRQEIALLEEAKDFQVFGRKHISSNAYQQMKWAMKLPIAKQGALMPDAHQGYGLPIGGVLATENAVIPYGVGVDIGCRMSLSIYDLDAKYLQRYQYQLKVALKEKTNFGTGGELGFSQKHEILDRKEFAATPLLRQLHGKAVRQLGSSGSGNHFVEFGLVEVGTDNPWNLKAGEYVGLLAHSGSRGLGANIAMHYTEIAKQKCLLPSPTQNLAWLDLDSEEGQEYWLSMNLAGDYAKACHDQIHYNLSKALGIKAIAKVENHHNFAWKQKQADGSESIIHRKGATPAEKGVLGIIPSSMSSAGYIVSGRGETTALQSASHGAGRQFSRSKTREQMTRSKLKKILNKEQVTLIGGGLDEAPIAYKDIEAVMLSQRELVDVVGKFTPKIVRMDKA
ncbi:RtcB family protein [Sediminitomix flava]|uniref:3'-phosphate/5'-hydroxy nucleic acid ligase n=1 Tax=Sediminitomix flava TaxID=379075 RepID=A0A315ZDB3_SEDFL|nr:RtcB family protein [Sediminitomix flava]PWJ43180.1 tRNA-splicing ligase RtcB [Sediminitomix flava]